MLKAAIKIVERINPFAPALVAEWRIGYHIIKGFEIALFRHKQRISKGVTLLDFSGRVVVQYHVHPGKSGGGGILFLTVKGNIGRCFRAYLEQERS